MGRVKWIFLFHLLALYLAAPVFSAPNEDIAYSSFLRGDYLSSATQFETLWKVHKNKEARHFYILSLIGQRQWDKASVEIEALMSPAVVLSPQGPWIEGYFYRAYILQKKGELEKAEKAYTMLLGSAPDPSLVRYLLGRVTFLDGRYEEAISIFKDLIQTEHLLEAPARFYLAASLYQLSLQDTSYIISAKEQLEWLRDHPTNPKLTPVYENLLQALVRSGDSIVKPLDDPIGLSGALQSSVARHVYVWDPVFGIDPLAALESIAIRTDLSGALTYRFFRRNDHQLLAGYSAAGTFHFSTKLFPFDRVVHGPQLIYKTRAHLGSYPIEISIKEQFLDAQANLSSLRNALYANVNTLAATVQFSRALATRLELQFAYQKTSNLISTSDVASATLPSMYLYASGMSGIKMGALAKQYFYSEDSFLFNFPLTLTLFGGFQNHLADSPTYSRLAFLGGLEAWVPVRWGLQMGLSGLGAYSLFDDAARGTETYMTGNLFLKRSIASQAYLVFETNVFYRMANSEYGFLDFNLLLRAEYVY